MTEQRRPAPAGAGARNRRSDVLALGSFVVLGLPDGILGTAWPSMRATFGAPVGDLGLILLLGTAGSVLVTVFVGTLIQRLGVPALLTVAGLCAAVGVTGYALAPGFGLVLGVSVLSGASAGMMDAGLNTTIALTGRQRLLNLLHGAYGVGTAIGPLVVTAAILTGSWRPAYLTLTVLDLAIAGSWLRQRRRDGPVSRAAEDAQAIEPQSGPQWSRRRYGAVLATGMSVFFLYTGLEVGAGQWEASFCRGHLNLSTGATGLATFGYWGALTAVRISLALVPRPVRPRTVVRSGIALAVIAAAVIWWQPGPALTVIAFAVLGGALAGVFPALITLTPGRIGERRAQHVIAWQVGAAAAGGAGVSALIGLLIGATSLAALGPALTTLAILVVASELILTRLAPVPVPVPAPGPGPSSSPGPAARRPSAGLDRVPDRARLRALDRVSGRLGHVLPSRRRDPPYISAGELLGLPPRVAWHFTWRRAHAAERVERRGTARPRPRHVAGAPAVAYEVDRRVVASIAACGGQGLWRHTCDRGGAGPQLRRMDDLMRIRRSLAAVAAVFVVAAGTVAAIVVTGTQTGASTLCDEQTRSVAGGRYAVQNNEYNSTAPACITASGGADFRVKNSSISNTTDGLPGGYPSIYQGCHWGDCSSGGLAATPVQVSDLEPGTVTTTWSTSQPGSGSYYAAYDIWFNKTPATTGQPDCTELMVWLNHHGPVQPFGTQIATGVSVGGRSYDIWAGQRPAWDAISYEMPADATSVSGLDIGVLAQDAVSRGYLSSSCYLISVEAGFGLWHGGAGLATHSFSVDIKAPQ